MGNCIFVPIDYDSWPRKEIFELFSSKRKCTFDIAISLDVTAAKIYSQRTSIKFSHLLTFCISKVVNSDRCFRTEVNQEGVLGYWQVLHPMYTIPTKPDGLFTHIMTAYSANMKEFTSSMLRNNERYRATRSLYPQAPLPANIFALTTIPWVSFTGISYNVYGDGNYMIPFISMGKYHELNGRLQLPLSVQFHHATCDGYHAGMFFERLQTEINALDNP
ncbi:CatA-like O-acetyltransferase [Photobacterium nomapromontoriensis]|uniref:CatA-like O-acetyltransferase n=1 Tax=Photobacterium nomapromontoriensis TaxID=2910237 RepID=UPI003D130208